MTTPSPDVLAARTAFVNSMVADSDELYLYWEAKIEEIAKRITDDEYNTALGMAIDYCDNYFYEEMKAA